MYCFLENIDDYIFIIDSYKLGDVKQKLYGYVIQNGDFAQNEDINHDLNFGNIGAFVHVKVSDSYINISQDFNGSHGIYIYTNDNHFVISNSFLNLVEYLKMRYPISFNKDYADAFLLAPMCSFVYSETMINEITVLPRNYEITINKQNKTIEYTKINYQENSINLDTQEGIRILDEWYENWTSIIRSIRSKTNYMDFDLSGGYDSRIVAALWLSANINLENINIKSYIRSPEDYKIASQIAEDFNFKLNNGLPNSYYFPEKMSEIIDMSFYSKLGFHKEMYYNTFIRLNPSYAFGGTAGESIRGYPNKKIDEYVEWFISPLRKYGTLLSESTLNIIDRGLTEISNEHNIHDEYDLAIWMYKESRNRNHFGKSIVEDYFCNRIIFTPLIDPNLHKLNISTPDCNDKNLLMIMILLRYCPILLEYDVEGNRNYNRETIEYAKKINEKFPFVKKNCEFVKGPEKNTDVKNINKNPHIDPNEYMKKIFLSNAFKREFIKYYPIEIYDDIKIITETKEKFPVSEINSSIAIIKFINDVKFNKFKDYDSFEWLESFSKEYYKYNISKL